MVFARTRGVGWLLGLGLCLALAPQLAAQQWTVVKGRVARDSADLQGWVGVTVSIPAARDGVRAGAQGRFRLFVPRGSGCVELVVAGRVSRAVRMSFEVAGDSVVDLGTVDVPARASAIEEPPPPPLIRSGCELPTPRPPDRWIAGEAVIEGVLSRGGKPLAGVPVSAWCGVAIGPGLHEETDSAGRYRLSIAARFPESLELTRGMAPCRLRVATGAVEQGGDRFPVGFVSPGERPSPAVHDITLPVPSMDLGSLPAERSTMVTSRTRDTLEIPGYAWLRPGITTGPQALSLELLPRPDRVRLFHPRSVVTVADREPSEAEVALQPGTSLSGDSIRFLPYAFRIAFGQQPPTSTTELYVVLPEPIHQQLHAGARLRTFARAMPSIVGADDVYLPITVHHYPPDVGVATVALSHYLWGYRAERGQSFETIVLVGVESSAGG